MIIQNKFVLALIMTAFSLQANALTLQPGDQIANFAAKNQDGKIISNTDIAGKPTLFYFYPMDESPDCTKEACAFRDKFASFKKTGILIFGVSSQDANSHKKFASHHKIPFDLLDDSDGKMGTVFGIEKNTDSGYYKRQSVLVGGDGKVIKVYTEVDPKSHPKN